MCVNCDVNIKIVNFLITLKKNNVLLGAPYQVNFFFVNAQMLKDVIFYFFAEGPLPSVLQQVAVPVINNSVCEAMYRNAGYIEHIPHIFICAGWRNGGFDSCEVSILCFT